MTLQLQDPRSLVRQVIEHELATSPTLKVVIDGPMIVKVALRQGLEIDSTAACHVLNGIAPTYGFAPMGSDSRGRIQWQRENPRFVWCSRHHRRSILKAYREGGRLSFRAVHSWHGRGLACRVDSVSIDLLSRVLPRLGEICSQSPGWRNNGEKTDVDMAGG